MLSKELIVHTIHKLLVYFTIFGFLLPRKYLICHLLVFPIILFHWILNDNKCAFTQLTNTICYPEYSGYKGFNDFSRMLGLQDKYPNISYYYLGGVILYDLNQIWPILK